MLSFAKLDINLKIIALLLDKLSISSWGRGVLTVGNNVINIWDMITYDIAIVEVGGIGGTTV